MKKAGVKKKNQLYKYLIILVAIVIFVVLILAIIKIQNKKNNEDGSLPTLKFPFSSFLNKLISSVYKKGNVPIIPNLPVGYLEKCGQGYGDCSVCLRCESDVVVQILEASSPSNSDGLSVDGILVSINKKFSYPVCNKMDEEEDLRTNPAGATYCSTPKICKEGNCEEECPLGSNEQPCRNNTGVCYNKICHICNPSCNKGCEHCEYVSSNQYTGALCRKVSEGLQCEDSYTGRCINGKCEECNPLCPECQKCIYNPGETGYGSVGCVNHDDGIKCNEDSNGECFQGECKTCNPPCHPECQYCNYENGQSTCKNKNNNCNRVNDVQVPGGILEIGINLDGTIFSGLFTGACKNGVCVDCNPKCDLSCEICTSMAGCVKRPNDLDCYNFDNNKLGKCKDGACKTA